MCGLDARLVIVVGILKNSYKKLKTILLFLFLIKMTNIKYKLTNNNQ